MKQFCGFFLHSSSLKNLNYLKISHVPNMRIFSTFLNRGLSKLASSGKIMAT